MEEKNQFPFDGEPEQVPGIEESFQMIDEILAKLESEDTKLEDAFRLYEQGMKLIRQADGSLDRLEKKLKLVSGEEEI